jgi:hypothetical protein
MSTHYFVCYMPKKKKTTTREEDADYRASSNGAPDPGIME